VEEVREGNSVKKKECFRILQKELLPTPFWKKTRSVAEDREGKRGGGGGSSAKEVHKVEVRGGEGKKGSYVLAMLKKKDPQFMPFEPVFEGWEGGGPHSNEKGMGEGGKGDSKQGKDHHILPFLGKNDAATPLSGRDLYFTGTWSRARKKKKKNSP